MNDCLARGPLPGWSALMVARSLQAALPPLDVYSLVEQIPTPSYEWLMTNPGTKSRRRHKAARNADVRKRGHRCRRCGTTEGIRLHHVVPMSISDQLGSWRETQRDTLDLCVACHNLLEAALTRVLPVTVACDRWAAEQIKRHPEWLRLGGRGIIESRAIRWALAHLGREPSLAESYRLASRLFLELELPLTEGRVLHWELRRRLGRSCQRCAANSGLLYILPLPFSFVPGAMALGFDPLDPSAGATLCHPCARSYIHQATEMSDPQKDLALAIKVRTALLREWIACD
ncbi:MAG TPA: hypothetical protein VNO70_02485 [Blastocatellia bacterium]|nr:hypothetical protein [Blastocatellia bacterium]